MLHKLNIDYVLYKIEYDMLPHDVKELSRYTNIGEWILQNHNHNKNWKEKRSLTILMKCPHKKEKRQCKDCGGSSICIHDKRKSSCKECNPAFCTKCNGVYSKMTIKKHDKTCKK